MTYWDLQGDQPFEIPVDPEAEVKAPGDYSEVGNPQAARGLAELVTGEMLFVHDMTLPGMLHARVVRPPHYHARLQSLDAAACGRIEETGIKVVRDGSHIAVAGEDEYAVIKPGRTAYRRRHMGYGRRVADSRYLRKPDGERADQPSRRRRHSP